jgi:hypothetical protein
MMYRPASHAAHYNLLIECRQTLIFLSSKQKTYYYTWTYIYMSQTAVQENRRGNNKNQDWQLIHATGWGGARKRRYLPALTHRQICQVSWAAVQSFVRIVLINPSQQRFVIFLYFLSGLFRSKNLRQQKIARFTHPFCFFYQKSICFPCRCCYRHLEILTKSHLEGGGGE